MEILISILRKGVSQLDGKKQPNISFIRGSRLTDDDSVLFFANMADWLHHNTSERHTVHDITSHKVYTMWKDTWRDCGFSKCIYEWVGERERSALSDIIVIHQSKVLGKRTLRRQSFPSFRHGSFQTLLPSPPPLLLTWVLFAVRQKPCMCVCYDELYSRLSGLRMFVFPCTLQLCPYTCAHLHILQNERKSLCLNAHLHLDELWLWVHVFSCLCPYTHSETKQVTQQ